MEAGQTEPAAETPKKAPLGAEAQVRETTAPVGKVGEWFWQRRRMAELRRRAELETADTARFEECARLSAELAERALDSAESFLSGRADGLAAELYRESIYWALRLLETRPADNGAAHSPPASTADRAALERLWSNLPDELSGRMDGERAERLKQLFVHHSFVEFAELPPAEQTRVARELGQVAHSLLRASSSARKEIERLYFQRTLRVGAALLLVIAAVVTLFVVQARREAAADLASGKPWQVSSNYGAGHGCESPEQSCSDSPHYFFHTAEEDKPWVEIDLGAPQAISRVIVENRQDCCTERAVPLVLEVSLDQKTFRQVAREDEVFDTWRAKFEKVEARYVRVRAARRTMLHLSLVRVLPN